MDHLPVLEVLCVEGYKMEAVISSHSLVKVEMKAFSGFPYAVRSEAPQPVD